MNQRKLTIEVDAYDSATIECRKCGEQVWEGENGDSFTIEELTHGYCSCEGHRGIQAAETHLRRLNQKGRVMFLVQGAAHKLIEAKGEIEKERKP